MKADPLKVMTTRLNKKTVAVADSLMNDLGLRRDAYLRSQLASEIETLAENEPNTEATYRILQMMRHADQGAERVKVGLRLPQSLIDRINEVCAEKRVPRDLFVETFYDFLANGWPDEGVISPLAKALDYLEQPYRDFLGNSNIYGRRCHWSDAHAEITKDLLELDSTPKKTRRRRTK